MHPNKILVGTTKGLVVVGKIQGQWQIEQVHFMGMPVSMVFADERDGTWWVGIAHRHWGQKLHYTTDEGQHWQQVPMPKFPLGAELKPGKPATLKKIWCMEHAGHDRPGGLWLGTEPGGLFFSDDHGQHFRLVESLWEHPSRVDENQWFGAGRDFPFIHSIVVDPRDSEHLYIAVSCAGVFETKNFGQSWEPRNKGLIAAYLPNPEVEVGHDPHRVLACAAQPDVLWQQNHCGVFRSSNGGAFWENVGDQAGLSTYGFALAIDHTNPLRAWTIPAISDEIRVAKDLALCVNHTQDGGKTWQSQHRGLPQEHCFDIVFRHAFDGSGSTLVFGTTTGNLYVSEDYGASWACISNNLAGVDFVKILTNVYTM